MANATASEKGFTYYHTEKEGRNPEEHEFIVNGGISDANLETIRIAYTPDSKYVSLSFVPKNKSNPGTDSFARAQKLSKEFGPSIGHGYIHELYYSDITPEKFAKLLSALAPKATRENGQSAWASDVSVSPVITSKAAVGIIDEFIEKCGCNPTDVGVIGALGCTLTDDIDYSRAQLRANIPGRLADYEKLRTAGLSKKELEEKGYTAEAIKEITAPKDGYHLYKMQIGGLLENTDIISLEEAAFYGPHKPGCKEKHVCATKVKLNPYDVKMKPVDMAEVIRKEYNIIAKSPEQLRASGISKDENTIMVTATMGETARVLKKIGLSIPESLVQQLEALPREGHAFAQAATDPEMKMRKTIVGAQENFRKKIVARKANASDGNPAPPGSGARGA